MPIVASMTRAESMEITFTGYEGEQGLSRTGVWHATIKDGGQSFNALITSGKNKVGDAVYYVDNVDAHTTWSDGKPIILHQMTLSSREFDEAFSNVKSPAMEITIDKYNGNEAGTREWAVNAKAVNGTPFNGVIREHRNEVGDNEFELVRTDTGADGRPRETHVATLSTREFDKHLKEFVHHLSAAPSPPIHPLSSAPSHPSEAEVQTFFGNVYSGYLEEVKKELLANPNLVNAKNNNGETALYCAAAMPNHDRVVALLIAAHADVNAKDNNGETALYRATIQGRTDSAVALIAAHADVNAKDHDGGHTPLDRAAAFGNKDIAAALIRAGAHVNAKDNVGHTPLHTAALAGNKDIVAALIKAGADVNAKSNQGYTAQDLAKVYTHEDVAAMLEKRPEVSVTHPAKPVAKPEVAVQVLPEKPVSTRPGGLYTRAPSASQLGNKRIRACSGRSIGSEGEQVCRGFEGME